MYEVENSKYYCNGCNDLCTIITAKSSEKPNRCVKSDNKKSNWFQTQ